MDFELFLKMYSGRFIKVDKLNKRINIILINLDREWPHDPGIHKYMWRVTGRTSLETTWKAGSESSEKYSAFSTKALTHSL